MPAKFEADPEEVMNLAFGLKINQKKMKKMEKEYTTMKTKEKEDEIELRVIKYPLFSSAHLSNVIKLCRDSELKTVFCDNASICWSKSRATWRTA